MPDTLAGVPIDPDLAREVSRAARMTETWRASRDRLIRQAHAAGGSLREIGKLAGMTHRAVSKIVAKGDSRDEPSR